jgi:type VI secretion system protein ImpH
MAAPDGQAELVVSTLDQMSAEPWRFDFYDVLRQLERANPNSPRIGESASRRDEFVDLGQDPYLEFPASNLASVAVRDARVQIIVKFLGLLGPQGALPLATTEETLGWLIMRDDAFPRFLDLLNNRFLQLFFRAWANARPIAQHDRPDQDRFIAYVGSFIGLGTTTFRNQDSVSDIAKLEFAGLLAPKAKSASRLERFLAGLFDTRIEIAEFVGTWLSFEPRDCSTIGGRNAGLGKDLMLGRSVFSLEDKIRIRLYVKNLAHYERFLPTGRSDLAKPLADAVFFYVGDELDWDVELAIPSGEVAPMKLGVSGRLGWTGWVAPNWSATDQYRCDARFHLAERLRANAKALSETEAGNA